MIGTRLKIIITAIAVLGGSGFAAYQAGIISVPEYGVQDRGDWKNVSDSSITVESTAWIDNENPVGLELSKLELKYDLKMNGVKMAEGSRKGAEIEKGNQTLKVETELYQKKIPKWWISHIRNDEVTEVDVSFGLRRNLFGFPLKVNGINYGTEIETNLEKTLTEAMDSMKGRYSGPAFAGIESTRPEIVIEGGSAEFGKVTREETVLNADVRVTNPNSYPIPTPRLKGETVLNDVMLANISSEPIRSVEDAQIPPGETRTVDFQAVIDNGKVDDWLTEHAKDEEVSEGNVNLYLVFGFEEYSFQLPAAECGLRIQTGIFVDDQNSSTGFQGCETVGETSASGTGSDNQSDGGLLEDGLNDSDSSEESSNGTSSDDSGSLTETITG